ncbi:amino acid ABC transporter permease [Achromobacter mucicolens]|uniref:amino acid ABC transporter permease n=1 Tax=Achromobacter mucicolens TaxID=1389922 RepID=UPI0028A83782|nr:amino acid ABC transporter permease [Achromobacter mucicolens]
MDEILQNFFNLNIYVSVAPYLLQGLGRTLMLSAMVIPVGLASGLLIGVLSVTLKAPWSRVLLAIYIDFFRALPPLVLLIFIYFGAPFLGLDLPKLLAVAVGFMLNNSSYYGEVFRAGLESVPRGQIEAARSTGLSAWQTMWHVQIPQATRNVMPDLISNTLEVVKLTTLASAVALPELLRVARDAQSLVYNPSPIVLAALFYLALLWPVVRLLSRLEHRQLSRH